MFLQFNVDLGFKELVEVRAAHWAVCTLLENFSVALDAHEVLARSQNRLNAKLPADGTLEVVFCTENLNRVRLLTRSI